MTRALESLEYENENFRVNSSSRGGSCMVIFERLRVMITRIEELFFKDSSYTRVLHQYHGQRIRLTTKVMRITLASHL